MRREKVRREAHATRKKNFLPKHSLLRDEAMSFDSLCFAFSRYEWFVPLLSETLVSLTGQQMPRIWNEY